MREVRVPETGVTEWSWGVPLTGERALEAAERATLSGWARRMQGLTALSWLALGALGAAFAVAADRANPASALQQDTLAVWMILLIAGCLPLAMILTRRWVRRSVALWRDIRHGAVRCYSGPFDERFPGNDAAVRKLVQGDLLPVLPKRNWSIEVLPNSRRVWQIDGKAVPAWIEAPPAQLAQTPAFSAIAAEWLQPVGRTPDGEVLGGRRDLSEAERQELTRHGARAWRRPLPWAVAMTAWLALPLLLLASQRRLGNDADMIRFIFIAAFTGAADWLLIKGALIARKLARDRRLGHVVILRLSPAATRKDDAKNDDDDGPVEILPASGFIWTQSGQPAHWRKTA
jgi:hypothetical protein